MYLRTLTVLTLCLGVSVAGAATPGERFATLPEGLRLHYLEAGAATSKPALVLIPGWGMPASLWHEQLVRFSSDRQVVAVDPRSQGESGHTRDGNTPEQRARDLHALLGKLKLSRVVLVGWSQGAQDVAAYIQQFGTGALAGVAFVDSPVSAGPAELELNKEASTQTLKYLAIYAAHPAEYAEGMARAMFARPHPELDLKALAAHIRKTPTDTGIAMLVTDLFGADRRGALAKIDRPALVIASEKSPRLDEQKKMAGAISGARLVVVPEAGHALFVDQPEKFDAALQQLLDSASAPRQGPSSQPSR